MNKSQNQVYLAHSREIDGAPPSGDVAGGCIAEMRQEDAAEYIAGLLSSLRAIAIQARFRLLSDLLSVAEEEARLQIRA